MQNCTKRDFRAMKTVISFSIIRFFIDRNYGNYLTLMKKLLMRKIDQ